MGAKLIGGLLIFFGLGMLALGTVNYLGYGMGLDGNTPIIAVGAILIFLGWLKFGDTPKAEGERPGSISDNKR
jgi:hypothetical protein